VDFAVVVLVVGGAIGFLVWKIWSMVRSDSGSSGCGCSDGSKKCGKAKVFRPTGSQ
jgi:hypothetical protein